MAGYAAALHSLKNDDRLRGLKPRAGIDFASNDYLALASAPRMKKVVSAALDAGTPIGAGGSRLLISRHDASSQATSSHDAQKVADLASVHAARASGRDDQDRARRRPVSL
jgi:7-keto-8-aminopelargonate synthetase-like enzyme